MKRNNGHEWLIMTILALSFVMVGCASQRARQAEFRPHDFSGEISSGELAPRVDHFLVILDTSQGMGEVHRDGTRLSEARELVDRLARTVAPLKITGALRVYGGETRLAVGPSQYRSDPFFTNALSTVSPGGENTLGLALKEARQDLDGASGRSAVIIVSDGRAVDDPVSAAAALRDRYGDKVCLYSLLVGGDPSGRETLENTVWEAECGFSESAERLETAEGVADFARKVFLTRSPEGATGSPEPAKTETAAKADAPESTEPATTDSDGDGVADDADECPYTPRGVISVNEKGCWIIASVRFDTNQDRIRPEFRPGLDEVATAMKANPDLKVLLQGHADNVGSAAYNRKLSEKRAKAVAAYLISKGVPSKRLSTIGAGSSSPVADNATAEGRARNRRVEIEPLRVR